MDTNPPGNVPGFFGQKVSRPGINVSSAGDNELILKDDYSTRTYYDSNGQPLLQLGLSPNTNNQAYGLQLIDSSGNVVARYGEQPDGTFNLKFFDTNGIGIAQFGRFPDGSTALKVAEPGVEVSTAANDQLVFNSGQDIFKIITSGLITVPQYTVSGGTAGQSTGSATLVASDFELTGSELCIGYNYTQATAVADPWTGDHLGISGFGSGGALAIGSFQTHTLTYRVVNDVATIQAVSGGPVASGIGSETFGPYIVKYFILQETVTN